MLLSNEKEWNQWRGVVIAPAKSFTNTGIAPTSSTYDTKFLIFKMNCLLVLEPNSCAN